MDYDHYDSRLFSLELPNNIAFLRLGTSRGPNQAMTELSILLYLHKQYSRVIENHINHEA